MVNQESYTIIEKFQVVKVAMTPQILAFMQKAKEDIKPFIGRVLEVGSFDINGSPRSVFQSESTNYIGIDKSEGKGVDRVLDAEQLATTFLPEEFDTVICCECLEHTVRPWVIVEALWRLLKAGGFLWISTPTYGFPLHRFPLDCYRYGEDAYRYWMYVNNQLLRIETTYDGLGQPCIAAVGRKL